MKDVFRRYAGILVICLIFLFAGLFSLNQMVLYTPDSARYLAWANSLANAEGFKDATTPEPSRYVIHAPLYSILLVPSAVLFPNSLIAAKILTLLIGCFAIFFFYLWLLQRIENVYALLGALLLALNPLMLMFSTQILSDIPFTLSLILFLLLARKIVKERKLGSSDYWLSAVIITGVLLREVGFSLMFAAVIYFLWMKQYRRALVIVLTSMLFYLLWFYRNEIVIANFENPPLRNSQLFFTHLYSSGQASIIKEFVARFWNNLVVYASIAGKLLFMPDYSAGLNKLVSVNDPFVAVTVAIIPFLQYVLISATIGLAGIGIWKDLKNSKIVLIIGIFIACYLGMILFYPIIDIRFLFPLVIVLLYFFIIGLKQSVDWLHEKVNSRSGNIIALSLLLVFLFPNVSWIKSFISNSRLYGKSAEELYKSFQQDPKYPEIFSNPLHLAGQWIARHSDSSAVVYTYWKELAIWMEGRKIILGSPLTPPTQFDYQLRDYDVKYIVAIHWRSTLNECEPFLANSQRFRFVLVHEAGNVQVFEVVDKKRFFKKGENIKNVPHQIAHARFFENDSLDVDSLYERALRLLEDDPQKAEIAFQDLNVRVKRSPVIEYHLGVAKEFIGQLDSAGIIFDKFGSLMQAGPFIIRAWQHKEFISFLKEADSTTNIYERNMSLLKVAVNYKSLGYQKQAVRVLDRLIKTDSTFSPALVNHAIYSFQQGDTLLAKRYLEKARVIEPFNDLTNSFISAMQYFDSLHSNNNIARKKELHMRIAGSYIMMGFFENAVDEFMMISNLDPFDTVPVQLLGNLFEVLKRYGPALHCYKTILAIDPTNEEIKKRINILSARF